MLSVLKLTLTAATVLGASAARTKLPTIDLGYEIHQAAAYSTRTGYYTFQNIPFAQPPLDSLRWAPPQKPIANRSVVNDGSSVSGVCPGTLPAWLNNNLFGIPNITNGQDVSEDCLYLDVYVPKGTPRKAKSDSRSPVLVWMHGGANEIGDKSPYANGAGYDGLLSRAKNTASEHGMIFVAINYRLGAFGFLAGHRLQNEHGTPNVGLLDQRAALEWVQEYICEFGGDPQRVTILGESAGAGDILEQLVAYGGKARLPFQQAILQSPILYPTPRTRSKDSDYEEFLKAVNATSLTQLRTIDTETLIDVNQNVISAAAFPSIAFGTGIAVDGSFVQDSAVRLLQQGKFDHKVKIMVGINSDEGAVFVATNITGIKGYSFAGLVKSYMPRATTSDISYISNVLYPPVGSQALYQNEHERASQFAGDLLVYDKELVLSNAFGNKTHVYEFSVPPGYHLEDVDYTFADGLSDAVNTAAKLEVATALQSYILAFVTSGTPNPTGLPEIPVYGSGHVLNLTLDGFHTVPDPASNQRTAFLASRKYD